MRRSFGKTGMGGGGMLRTVGRAVGSGVGGVQEALSGSKPKPTSILNVSSSSSSKLNLPFSTTTSTSASNSRSSSPVLYDVDEWEFFEEEEEGRDGISERFVFGPVPSKDEVEEAVSALHQVFVPIAYSQVTEDRPPVTLNKDSADQKASAYDLMRRVPSGESESDWIEPSLNIYNPRALQSEGYDNVLDAFRLLKMNPSVQRMVASLSSDKAIWDAVMKNEVVLELKESFYAGENTDGSSPPPEKRPEVATRILRWILGSTKAKIMDFMDKIMKLVNDLFGVPHMENKAATFEDMVRSSLMLSVIVLMVVVVTRVERA
ncbi:uncharacterized protein LOC143877292 [Tasmannia lanceolata]|uniref:uncharacterized protein LOC143877292 n=1 Tax=Tasmannia lanceolata TaxID=3420 RepID=UPI00406369DB